LWKSRKGYAPAGRLYSRFRSNLSKNFNFGGPTPLSLHRWGATGCPHRCNVSPLRGEKPQNRPLSKRNTGRFALRAMLPVITAKFCDNNLTCTCSCTVHEAGKFDSKKMLTCVAIQQKYHFVHHSAIECVLYYHKTLLQSAVVINSIVIMCIWLSHSCTIRKWRMYHQIFHHLVTQSF